MAKQSYCWISRLIAAIASICVISAPLHAATRAHAGAGGVAAAYHASLPSHEHKNSKPGDAPSCCHATCTTGLMIGPPENVFGGLSPSDVMRPVAVRIPPAAPLPGIDRPPKA